MTSIILLYVKNLDSGKYRHITHIFQSNRFMFMCNGLSQKEVAGQDLAFCMYPAISFREPLLTWSRPKLSVSPHCRSSLLS